MFRYRPIVAVLAVLLLPIRLHAAQSAEENVERIRQLEFDKPVIRKSIARSELRAFLEKQLDADLPYEPEDYVKILRALFLLDEVEDPLGRLFTLYEAQALAFYDPRTHVYYSMDAPDAASEDSLVPDEAVEVHELVHALQDQRFGIGPKLDAVRLDWDAAMAYQALLEGEASLVMMAGLYESMGLDFDTIIKDDAFLGLLAAASSQNAGIPEGTPEYWVESMSFPYVDGLRFVIHAYRHGGWKALDRVHAHPPRSTEEILHPELYKPDRRRVKGLAAGESGVDGPLLVTTLGEFHWKFLLDDEAAAGWASDRVEVEKGEEGALTVLGDSAWDTERDASEFASALREKLKAEGAAGEVVLAETRVRFAYGADKAAVKRFVRPSPTEAAPCASKKKLTD